MTVESDRRVDVAIVGASIAGCAAAIRLARTGARVALIERSPDIEAYKRACTHLIHGSALSAIERLDLLGPIRRAGGRLTGVELWTRWGTIRPRGGENGRPLQPELSVRRRVLDPLLRRTAAATDGVELLLGHAAVDLVRGPRGEVTGLVARRSDGATVRIDAQLVVGADGRASKVAELAKLRTRAGRNERFCYFAYFRGAELASGENCQIWFLDPDVAYAFPNDEDVTLLGVFPAKRRLAEFRGDLESAFERELARLPDAPDLSRAERISPVIGKLEMPNARRSVTAPGLAMVGDAALAADPVASVGCGWAFQSAEWLGESVGGALGDPVELRRALRRYARRHRAELAGHHRLISDGSKAGGMNPVERLFFAAATRDEETARHLYGFATRAIKPHRFLAPRAVARAATVLATRRRAISPTPYPTTDLDIAR